VRREFGRVRPALAEVLGTLEGQERDQFRARVEELTTGISTGKFSLAFQYPELVNQGRELVERQRVELAERARLARALDAVRRRVSGRLRDAGDLLSADARSRLQRSLRSATDEAGIAAVDAELDQVVGSAINAHSRRRDREIERTRARILRATPRTAEVEPPAETWQDVLRRFAEQQDGSAEPGA
jgi:hypothetical protein